MSLFQYTADHRRLLELVRDQAGLVDPVAIDLDQYEEPVLARARKGVFLPVDGLLVRDWAPHRRRADAGVRFGMRQFTIEGLHFVEVCASYHGDLDSAGASFFAVARRDYGRLFRIARRCRRDSQPPAQAPVLSDEQRRVLWQNTIGFLETDNLRRYREYGIRPRRGLLLLGPPGNGKTMACRHIWEECRQRGWEYRLVTPDEYKKARNDCDPEEEVRRLFTLDRKGIIFFDDFDLALRDRETTRETDDQAIFLTALDGIKIQEGIVFVFSSNCAPELIDRAFRRPGRLDLVLHFQEPDATLRRRLIERWHPEVRRHLDIEQAVAGTVGRSFAELEELKNLLVMHFFDVGYWDWPRALVQFDENRQELARAKRRVGFVQTNGQNH